MKNKFYTINSPREIYGMDGIVGPMTTPTALSFEDVLCMVRKGYEVYEHNPHELSEKVRVNIDNINNIKFSLSRPEAIIKKKLNKEMIELSLQFPNALFQLYGDGEENGDTWYTYYKNGKKQYCPAKITYDKYDENELK